MAALAWLLIPVTAVVVASLWGSWVGRRRTTIPDAVGVAGYERFRAAMERSSPEAGESAQGSAPGEEPSAASVAPTRAEAAAGHVSEGSGRAGS